MAVAGRVLWGLGLAAATAVGCSGLPALAEATPHPVRLFGDLEVVGAPKGPLPSNKATELLQEKLPDRGSPEMDDFLQLPDGRRVRVTTGAEYLAAIRRGAYPATTLDFHRDGAVSRTVGTLEFVRKAVPAQRSALPSDLSKCMPVRFLWWGDGGTPPDIERADRQGAPISNRVGSLRVSITKNSAHSTTFDASGLRRIRVDELARGDVDRDGSEDALIQVISTMPGGTYYAAQLWVVHSPRRKGAACRIEPFLRPR